jgi:hypothetical protein
VLKPAFIATKEAEGDTCSISDVIPLVKKLHHQINAVDRAGIVTFKTSFVNNLERYFDSKCKNPGKNTVSQHCKILAINLLAFDQKIRLGLPKSS